MAGKKRKNVSRSSHVSHLGGDRVDCCGKEQKWNEGRLDEAGWTSCQGMFKIAGGPAPLQGVGGKETLEGLRVDKTGTLSVERAQVGSYPWNLQKGTTGPNPPKAMEPP